MRFHIWNLTASDTTKSARIMEALGMSTVASMVNVIEVQEPYSLMAALPNIHTTNI